MAFSGPAPELINGRLAMVAMVSAIGAELASGESFLRQLADQPTLITLAAVLVAAGSLVPLLDGNANAKSPISALTASAEMTNGRAAMLGVVGMIVTEKALGHALF